MRTVISMLTALALLSACSRVAVDTADEASGGIVGFDETPITLDAGGTFVVPEDSRYLTNELDTGDSVTIFYKEVDGKRVVQNIMGVE